MTEREHAVFRVLMIGIMVSMMDADGSADSLELDAITAIYGELAGGPIPPAVLKEGIELARMAGAESAVELARNFNSRLDQLSRELVFRSALYISAADRVLSQEEMDLLAKVGMSLGLDEEHMGAILKSAQNDGRITLGDWT
ncbi:TerB family tellurite resistance protein [Bacteroidota bacterium]